MQWRMGRLIGLAMVLLLGTACMEEAFERLVTTVTWDPEAGRLSWELHFENVGSGLLDCETLAECKEATEKPDLFSLATDGAEGLVQRWVRDGNELDLIITATSADHGSDFAGKIGVVVETGGRLGKERPRLAVVHTEAGRPLNPGKRTEHRTWEVQTENGTRTHESWSMHPKDRQVKLLMTPEEKIEYKPIFEEYPELAAAMGL